MQSSVNSIKEELYANLFSSIDQQFGNGEEATHTPISLRESLLEQAIDMGYKLLETVAEYYPQGLVGPFAIQ